MVGLGAFPQFAPKYLDLGVSVLPCGGVDGKKPLVCGYTTRRFGASAIEKWSKEFPEANVGLCPGLNNLTVVDIDDIRIVGDCVQRFGDTPLKTRTPRNGVHLWYRNSGETCRNLRPNLAVDIKAIGGLVLLPPSANFQTGHQWQFIDGDWTDLASQKLPSIKPGSIPLPTRSQDLPVKPVHEMRDGDGRNLRLFNYLLGRASHIDSEEALITEAFSFNQQFADTMTENEVLRVVGSIMKYKREGSLFVKGCEPQSRVSKSERLALQDEPDALALLLIIRENHNARCLRGETFALSPTGMAAAAKKPGSQLPNWGHKRYAKARDRLLDCRMITLVKRHTRKHPSQYILTDA